MKAIIIDDERHALRRLNSLLDQIENVQVIGSFEDPIEALELMKSIKPDMVFLDIEMPMNGLEVFGKIMDLYGFVSIIFTTAYNQYAIKAFELNAIDYLLKPFKLDRLKKAVDRVEKYNKSFQRVESTINNNEIHIECFKRLSMYYGGNIINHNWRTKKADELIAYLVCEKGNYVSKDKIIDNLWPDLDSRKGLNNLYTTLYYIRKQEQRLGVSIPIVSVRGKMRLDMEHIKVDILEFEEEYLQYKRGRDAPRKELMNLYKGMLFEEHDYPWALIHQSQYDYWYNELIGD